MQILSGCLQLFSYLLRNVNCCCMHSAYICFSWLSTWKLHMCFICLVLHCSVFVIVSLWSYILPGCMCFADVWWKFGQLCWCEKHSCWNGHILSSAGNPHLIDTCLCPMLADLFRCFFLYLHCSFQDDYLDCFGDPEVIGKVNESVPFNCISLSIFQIHVQYLYAQPITWYRISCFVSYLFIYQCSFSLTDWDRHWRFQVLLAGCASHWACQWRSDENITCKSSLVWLPFSSFSWIKSNVLDVIFQENYGKKDAACVAKVKALYKELNLQVWMLCFGATIPCLCT